MAPEEKAEAKAAAAEVVQKSVKDEPQVRV